MLDQMNISELKALLNLLDEPDDRVYATIHNKIMDYGLRAVPFLEEFQYKTTNTTSVSRAENLIRNIHNHLHFLKLDDWALHRSHDLLEAYCLISSLYQEEESCKANRISVDKLYRDVWLEMNDELTALEKIRVINHIFFEIYRYAGHQSEQASLPAYLLGNLLRMQLGNPLSLSLLFLIITQKLGLPIYGVNLPHHFILAYMDDTITTRKAEEYTQNEVLFYINPFDKGALFRKTEIELFLKQRNIPPHKHYYLPCNNITVIRRLLNELLMLHRKNHQKNREETIKHLLEAVKQKG